MADSIVNVTRMEIKKPTDDDVEHHATYWKVEKLTGDMAEDAQNVAMVEVTGEHTRIAHCLYCHSVAYMEPPCDHIEHVREEAGVQDS